MKEVFRIIGERQILPTIVKIRIRNYTGQCITKYSNLKDNLEGRGEKNGGRRRRQLIDSIRVDDDTSRHIRAGGGLGVLEKF